MLLGELVLVTIFLIGGIARGGDVGALSQGLIWEKESLEFQPAPGTQEIRGSFRFTNRSSASVGLERITPNCGCLEIVSFPKETAAGGSGVIEFIYKAAGKEGVQTARIEVQPSGASQSLQTLRLRLELSPRVSVQPGLVIWGKAVKSKEVAIAVIDPALTLDQAVAITGDFAATLVPAETTKRFQLRLERPTKPGPAKGWATLTFRDGSNKLLERRIRLIAD